MPVLIQGLLAEAKTGPGLVSAWTENLLNSMKEEEESIIKIETRNYEAMLTSHMIRKLTY